MNITKPDVPICLTEPVQLRYRDKLHVINRFIDLDVWIKGPKGVAHIKRGARVAKNLGTKLLIGTDILGPEEITINVAKQVARIGQCNNFEFLINTKSDR